VSMLVEQEKESKTSKFGSGHGASGNEAHCWWPGVVGSAFRLKRSYSTPGPVSTAIG